jgi:hypothetical protein
MYTQQALGVAVDEQNNVLLGGQFTGDINPGQRRSNALGRQQLRHLRRSLRAVVVNGREPLEHEQTSGLFAFWGLPRRSLLAEAHVSVSGRLGRTRRERWTPRLAEIVNRPSA